MFKSPVSDQAEPLKVSALATSFAPGLVAPPTAITASAPSGITSTNEDDFMFFINGAIAENDALTVQQSGSIFYLKVNNNSIGYDLQNIDEIVAWGKFNS